jgi:hypothetical protein
MILAPQDSHSIHFWIAGLDAASAFLGMVGTYFMARRYASSFLWGMLFALVGTLLYIVGKGQKVRKFYTGGQLGSKDIKDAAGDAALGLNLLFLAFLIQLARIIVSAFFERA